MKTCIVGAGAIGAMIGVQLAEAGTEVSVLARGETARAIRKHGWRLTMDDGRALSPRVRVFEDPSNEQPVDLLVIALKEPAMASLAPQLAPLIGPKTLILPAMNGVPWWFFKGFEGPWKDKTLDIIDPQGSISQALPPSQVIGCVVHASYTNVGEGQVRHAKGNKLFLGLPQGGESQDLTRVATVLANAGIEVIISPQIQNDVWYKLWGNMTMNPISALTGATCDLIVDDPLVSRFVLDVMEEAKEIGIAIGCPIAESGEDRNQITRKIGAFKTSMLQDVEAGKALEINAILATVQEIGQWTNIPTPRLNALLGLVSLMGRVRGLYL